MRGEGTTAEGRSTRWTAATTRTARGEESEGDARRRGPRTKNPKVKQQLLHQTRRHQSKTEGSAGRRRHAHQPNGGRREEGGAVVPGDTGDHVRGSGDVWVKVQLVDSPQAQPDWPGTHTGGLRGYEQNTVSDPNIRRAMTKNRQRKNRNAKDNGARKPRTPQRCTTRSRPKPNDLIWLMIKRTLTENEKNACRVLSTIGQITKRLVRLDLE